MEPQACPCGSRFIKHRVAHATEIDAWYINIREKRHGSAQDWCTDVSSPLSLQMLAANRIVEPQACPCGSAFIKHRVAHATETDAEDINIRLGTGEEAWLRTGLDPKARRNPRRSGREAQVSHFTGSKLIQHHNQQSWD